jgi:hypothetical protein
MVHFGPQRYSFSLKLKKLRDIFSSKSLIFLILGIASSIARWTLQYYQFKTICIENS